MIYSKITLNCLICGKEFKVYKCRGKTAHYCSQKCAYSSKDRGNKISKSKVGKKISTLGGKHWWKCPGSFKKGNIPWIKGKEYPRMKGNKNPMWAGGISFGKYDFDFTTRLKESIRERDNYTCQECGYDQTRLGYKLCVHHIDYDKKNCNPNNLISLCKSCHTQTNWDRADWANYFKTKQYGKQI